MPCQNILLPGPDRTPLVSLHVHPYELLLLPRFHGTRPSYYPCPQDQASWKMAHTDTHSEVLLDKLLLQLSLCQVPNKAHSADSHPLAPYRLVSQNSGKFRNYRWYKHNVHHHIHRMPAGLRQPRQAHLFQTSVRLCSRL